MDDNGLVRGVILTANRDAAGAAGWDGCPDLLLPLANTPFVEQILTEYARAGVRETLISAGRDTGQIASRYGDGARWDMALAYQDAREGQRLQERVSEMAAFTKGAPFLVSPGPLLLESEVYSRLVQSYGERSPCGIRAGRHAGNTYSAGNTCSKADGDADGGFGIYLMSPRIYEILNCVGTRNESPESLFYAALDEFAARGETVLNLDVDHPLYCVGSPEAYLESNERLLASGSVIMKKKLPEIMSDNFSSPNVVMHPPAIVDDTAEIERCRIGPGVCIGPGVRIGHGAAIEHSVIMEGADIGDGASISHAVIGRNTSIENRAVIHGQADHVAVVRSRLPDSPTDLIEPRQRGPAPLA